MKTLEATEYSGAQHARPPKTDFNGRDGILPSVCSSVSPSAAGKMPALPKEKPVGNMPTLPRRKHPAHGVFISGAPTIVFLTVCTENKTPWLACAAVHSALVDVWKVADAWSVGYYLLMPDHIHLFCSPHKPEFTLKTWVTHWKRKLSCLHLAEAGNWQRDFWDTRLRREENYHDKWEYVRQNPVRKDLVSKAEDWPFQGVLNELRW